MHLRYMWLPMLVSVVCFYIENMYGLYSYFDTQAMIIKTVSGCAIGLLVGFAYFYLSPGLIKPQTVLVVFYGLSAIGIVLWRLMFDMRFRHSHSVHNYVIFGWNDTVRELVNNQEERNYIPFKPVAVYADSEVLDSPVPVVYNKEDLEKIVEQYDVDNFVMALNQNLPTDITRFLFGKIQNYSRFYSVPDFYEMTKTKIPLGSINEQWILQNMCIDGRLVFKFFKRVFDILFSVFLLVLTVWFWPIVALIIKLESKGPVFFKQVREGLGSRCFTLLKFRSMKTEHNAFSPTSQNDSRITKFGDFMRKTRIDELPQLLNVLKGDMSLIGPRPERPELAVNLEKEIPYYRQRLLVKPGITGLDQVSGEYHSPSIEDTYKKVQYDLYYVKNQSILLDGSIFFKTIWTVIQKLGR